MNTSHKTSYKTKWLLAGVCAIAMMVPFSTPKAEELVSTTFEMAQLDTNAPAQEGLNAPQMAPDFPFDDDLPLAETDVAPAPVPAQAQQQSLTQTQASTSQPVPHSGQYYDSGSIMPDAALGTSVGPREVDPKYEPGSSFVVVTKSSGANSFSARLIAGQRALKLGRYSSALEIYEQLYRESAKNRQVLMGLAVAQQNSGFTQSALATYEELLQVDPNNVDATVNMLGLVQNQYPAVAYRKLHELWDKNSQNPGIAAQLGLTSAKMGNAQDAIRYLGIASSLEPRNATHLYNMAVITDQIGAYKDALDLYEHALEVDATYGGSRTVPREQIYDRLVSLRRL